MDRYDIGFKIAKLVATSEEPLEDLKYIKKIINEMWNMYIDREDIRMKSEK